MEWYFDCFLPSPYDSLIIATGHSREEVFDCAGSDSVNNSDLSRPVHYLTYLIRFCDNKTEERNIYNLEGVIGRQKII